MKKRVSLQEKICLIEQSDDLLSIVTKIDLFLVISKQKIATFFPRAVCGRCPFRGSNNMDEFLKEVKNFLTQLGIFYQVTKRKDFPDFVFIFVALSRENLSRVLLAYKNNDEHEIGRCFGYPESAIEAYLGERKRKSIKEMQDQFGRRSVYFFTQFVFSEEFYKDEIKSTSLRWLTITKRLSPYLYNEVKKFVKSNIILLGRKPKQPL